MKKCLIYLLAAALLFSTAQAEPEYSTLIYEKNGVYIEYPYFYQDETLNQTIYHQVEKLIPFDVDAAQLNDPKVKWEYYEDGSKVIGSKHYQMAVTYANHSLISFVIWDYRNTRFDMHVTKDVFAFTIDRYTQKNLQLHEVFYTDQYRRQLNSLFFAKAALTDSPSITQNESDDGSSDQQFFDDMINYLYEVNESPFNVDYPHYFYLKPESAVVGLAVPHAAGDYFDGELSYEDLSPYMNPYIVNAMTE